MTQTSSRYSLTFIPDQISIATLKAVAESFQEMEEEIELQLSPSREKSSAHTKLQECFHWVKEAIRMDQISRNHIPLVDEGERIDRFNAENNQ